MESIYGDRTRQLARVRPTGPHPAIITCVVIFCICYVSYWVPTDLIRFDQICIITRQIMPNRKLSNQYYYYNKITMNRQFTRRRRDKGTQVNKRSVQTQGSKYGQKRVGTLGLLIMSQVLQGKFIIKQKLLRAINDRKTKFQENIHPFIYDCLKRIQDLQPSIDTPENQIYNNQYATLLTSSYLFYQIERGIWITAEHLSQKSLRFVFHKQLAKQIRALQNFSFKDLPLKIQDFEVFKGIPPVAVLNLGMKLVGMTISAIRQQQKQLFNYELSSKAQKYLIQKDFLFVLLRNGNIVHGKIKDELNILDSGKAKFQQLKLCGSDVLVLTRSYIIKILNPSGNPKKIIRAGVQISNVMPIYISTNLYVLMAEQEGKTCILNCYKSGKNNYLQSCPEGLEKIQETVYIGKWILLRTRTHKIYAFALTKDMPVKIFELYNGISPGMLKLLHRKLIQT